jgi:hypothetical protein
MLPARSPIQRSKTANPIDEKTFSTYQSNYSTEKTHGNLINHFGNDAYIYNSSQIPLIKQTKKSFLSPSYQNLTANAYISNRSCDSYSNNYRTSQSNPLHRPLYTAPDRTKLNHLFKIDTKSVAPLDKTALYEHNYFDNIVNDHFVSDGWLKTETLNLRDTIV